MTRRNGWRIAAVILVALALLVAVADGDPFNDGFGDTTVELTLIFVLAIVRLGSIAALGACCAPRVAREVLTRPA